ncbi:hypothetical protein L873DRAFT_1764180 [Choiromyces venosus 120613-1]|uniref:Nephrocystin 3-like N-terminal domain-containing protein n=1 Tax=Choiromyces venosus 120613-1 TaxID=1336337 RepID=A0A3N4JT06_9PEZI|nr:hypothetical protein L873DRAFT_1764180 [Choiromyces venosus 120613-1]
MYTTSPFNPTFRAIIIMDPTRCTNTVSLRDRNYHDGNVAHGFNTNNFITNRTNDTAEIMQWLSPLEPHNRHQGIRGDRCDGVGNWLLETNEFQQWRSGVGGADEAVLFCHGNPVVGKTFLSSMVMDRLCDHIEEGNIAVAGVYCDFREQEQTAANVMGAILKQLVLQESSIFGSIHKAFVKAKEECGGRRPQLRDHVLMLKTAIATLPRVFICIDALNEFTSKHLPDLLVSLVEIIHEIPSLRVFATGRPHTKWQLTKFFYSAFIIPIIPKTNDIEKYVERKLQMDTELHAMDSSLVADIQRTVRERKAET